MQSGAITSELQGLSAAAATDVWAVGYYTYPSVLSPQQGPPGKGPIIERWDGAAWQIVTGPTTDVLQDVTVVSANDVWAVGGEINYGSAGSQVYTPLIEHWNGTAWAVVSTPKTNANAIDLYAVAATGANDVWAVGETDQGSQHIGTPLIERWNGTAWSLVASPAQPANADAGLTAITAIPGTNQLWAVGGSRSRTSPAYPQALIERWNGSAWQVVQGPALPTGAFGLELHGVMALSATDAWAVGDYTASNHTIRTLTVHWDGTSWQTVASPDTWGSLTSVAAARSGDVRAVGYTTSGDGNTQTALVEQWNGTSWLSITPPTPSGSQWSTLHDVASDGAGGFWAVGSWRDASGNDQAFIERCP